MYDGQTKVESRVLQLEIFSLSDTSLTVIAGTVLSEDISDSTIQKEPACGAIVIATDQVTGKSYGKPTDFDGIFSFAVPPAEYTLKVVNTGYTKLIVPDVTIARGDSIVFNTLLGRAGFSEDSTIIIKVTDEQRKPK